jgi:hypothetical protein
MPSHITEVVPLRVPVPLAATQGTLALDLLPRREPPVAPVVPIAAGRRRGAEEWARRFAQAIVEIVGGDRPSTQVLRWTTRDVFADLDRRAVLVARAGGHVPGQGRVQPVRPRVLSVHTCFLHDAVFEASIHVRYGERSRAVAARFEARGPHWVCTALDWA